MSSSSLDDKDKPTKVISNLGPKIAAKKKDKKGQKKHQMTPFMEFMDKHGIRKEQKNVQQLFLYDVEKTVKKLVP